MLINISLALEVIASKLRCKFYKSNSGKLRVGQKNGFAVNLLFISENYGNYILFLIANHAKFTKIIFHNGKKIFV